jgi:hypothetical protein
MGAVAQHALQTLLQCLRDVVFAVAEIQMDDWVFLPLIGLAVKRQPLEEFPFAIEDGFKTGRASK